ncbi:hypothetical protein L4X63_23480 [Geomonas sp. Red32]|uniref:hypothetical protein n=1 Tax=Geomonas sp. Red32 TaxID=2912856 RepID=UPI00202CACB4|nr:hypothetical protein [Geomonas sp. Red32]MCM0084540.1 hypothetical protein [Geomonas sp. Red32]
MKIPNSIIEKAIAIVRSVVAGTEIEVQAEIQDEGAFLLIIAALPIENAEVIRTDALMSYETQLLLQLPPLIRPKDNGDYSWMVVFTENGKVVHAVMDTADLTTGTK